MSAFKIQISPRAYMRRWAHDGETPYKVLNEATGRMRLAKKFMMKEMTPNKVFDTDVALVSEEDVVSAVAELLGVVRLLAEEHDGPLSRAHHDGDDDEVGERACCGVVSYRDHAPDCLAVRLRAALAKFGGAK